MTQRTKSVIIAILIVPMLLLAACGPPSLLPDGPTAIPTLAPVTEPPSALELTDTPPFAVLSYPVRPPSALEGERIYQADCAQCHGEDGIGEVPGSRNFLDLDYIRGETPVDFYAAVTEGRGEMPGYNERLSSDERWDVVFFIWRLSTSREEIRAGKEIYEQNCGTCHGENGDAELLGSANFTDLRQMDSLAPRDLYLVTTQGRGSMPAWQSLLSQDERWAVISYIRTFSYDPFLDESESEEPTATPSPVESACSTEQENPFEWEDETIIQIGQKIYQQDCAACHGQDGSGGLPDTPDFTTQEVRDALQNNPGHNFCVVAEGEGLMPGFDGKLTGEEMWSVLTYLHALGP